KIDCATLVAVCDLEPILAEQLACRYSIAHWYSDFDLLLSQHAIDVVHIATPPQAHLPLARKSLAAGCHIFLEKPLAVDATEARALIDAVQSAGRKMAINYWYNFETQALALKEFIAQGSLGEPVHIDSYYGYDLGGEFGRALFSDPQHWVHQLPGMLFQ